MKIPKNIKPIAEIKRRIIDGDSRAQDILKERKEKFFNKMIAGIKKKT